MQRIAPGILLCAAGCGATLPLEEKVVEHRIIAAPVVVTESLDPAADPEGFERAEAMPGETVEVRPFVVSPDGVLDPAVINPQWIACELFPGRGEFACLAEAFPTSLAELPVCDFPDLDDLAAAGGPIEIETPCRLTTDPVPSFTVPASAGVLMGADIELTVIGSTPGKTPTDVCASELLRGATNVPNDCLYGVQVASVGPKLKLVDWLAQLGVDLGDIEPPRPGDIHDPDLHPRITSFAVSILDDKGEEVQAPLEVEDGAELEVQVGQTLRIDTTAPEEDLQEYRIPVNNGLPSQPEDEMYLGNWLITWGSLLSGQSLDPVSYNEWTLSPADSDAETPPNNIAHLFYVLRDSRNGAVPRSLTVRFVSP